MQLFTANYNNTMPLSPCITLRDRTEEFLKLKTETKHFATEKNKSINSTEASNTN